MKAAGDPLVHRGYGEVRIPEGPLVPREQLSERERWAVRIAATGVMMTAEKRELLDFLGYPDPAPTREDLAEAVVLRILGARARGEHIA